MTHDEHRHITVSETMHLPFAAKDVWPQLCPTREYDWIETWDCELVHSQSGFNELGCVFRTALPTEGDPETWVTCRFDPHERIEFVRSNSDRVIHFVIQLAPNATGGTDVTWTHHVTALNEAGRTYVKAKPTTFPVMVETLRTMLVHYLETGEMLRSGDAGRKEARSHHVHGGKTG